MGIIAVKRIYDPPSDKDGLRVLVDRLWPRGLTKQKAALDLWAKELAPSSALRQEFNHQPERFADFTFHYLCELAANPAVPSIRAELKRPKVTLLFGAHDWAHNHALVLADFLRGRARAPARAKTSPPNKRGALKKPASGKAAGKKTKTQAKARSRARSR